MTPLISGFFISKGGEMAQRQNTGNPMPSNSFKDLNDNTIIIDEWVNSDGEFTLDRFGQKIKTRFQITYELENVINEALESKDIIDKTVEDLPKILEGLRGPKGDKGDTGEVKITSLDHGYFMLSVNANGHLILTHNNSDPTPPFEIRDGRLIYKID